MPATILVTDGAAILNELTTSFDSIPGNNGVNIKGSRGERVQKGIPVGFIFSRRDLLRNDLVDTSHLRAVLVKVPPRSLELRLDYKNSVRLGMIVRREILPLRKVE